VSGKPYLAGIGDTVMDLRLTQSLPNVYGKADVFGRTRDGGRMTVRLVGLEGNQAIFVRQDVIIQSNESTMTQEPLVAPIIQTSSASGNVGVVPVSAARNTIGVTLLPPATAYSYPIQAGQVQIAAPIGGAVLIEGRRLKVLRGVDQGIEYSVD